MIRWLIGIQMDNLVFKSWDKNKTMHTFKNANLKIDNSCFLEGNFYKLVALVLVVFL